MSESALSRRGCSAAGLSACCAPFMAAHITTASNSNTSRVRPSKVTMAILSDKKLNTMVSPLADHKDTARAVRTGHDSHNHNSSEMPSKARNPTTAIRPSRLKRGSRPAVRCARVLA